MKWVASLFVRGTFLSVFMHKFLVLFTKTHSDEIHSLSVTFCIVFSYIAFLQNGWCSP